MWGELPNLRPIGSRPSDFPKNFPLSDHSPSAPQTALSFPRRTYSPHSAPSRKPSRKCSPPVTTQEKAFLTTDRILDNGCTPPRFLRMHDIARMVSMHYRDQGLKHYQMHAHVIMPNHVHLLVTPLEPVFRIMDSHEIYRQRRRRGCAT